MTQQKKRSRPSNGKSKTLKLVFTKSFKRDYNALREIIQRKVDKQLEFLLKDLNYPSLNAKKIKGTKDIWEARGRKSYRFTFQIEDGYYLLRRVGAHDTLENP